jgi:hypothetical protein
LAKVGNAGPEAPRDDSDHYFVLVGGRSPSAAWWIEGRYLFLILDVDVRRVRLWRYQNTSMAPGQRRKLFFSESS